MIAPSGFAREQLPLPTRPPYTAHLGNLSFDATEGDVSDFFSGCEVTNVRIVEDKLERKPKGFGYVEFGSLDGLKKALELSGTQFQGRNIRISVAEPRKYRDRRHKSRTLMRSQPRIVPKPRTCPTGLERVLFLTSRVRAVRPTEEGEAIVSSILVPMSEANVEAADGVLRRSRVMARSATSATGSERVPCRPFLKPDR